MSAVHPQSLLPDSQLTLYDAARCAIPVLDDDEEVEITAGVMEELQCMICFETMYEPTAVAQCLHRFCSACANRALRGQGKGTANLHCAACRHKLSSRRDLTVDEKFVGLVQVIDPGSILERQVEEEGEAASGEKNRNRRKRGRSRQNWEDLDNKGGLRSGVLQSSQQAPYPGAPRQAQDGNAAPRSPPLPEITQLFLRAPWELKMSDLREFVASRLEAAPTTITAKRLELLVLIPSASSLSRIPPVSTAAAGGGERADDGDGDVSVVVLDGSLSLRQVVQHFWPVTQELVIYYRLQQSMATNING